MDYSDLFDIHKKYIEYVTKLSKVNHQVVDNIRGSGDVVESYVRGLFDRLLPSRFDVTRGYIVKAEGKDDTPYISDEIDVIITDTQVTNLLFKLDEREGGYEVIPAESVVGIIEVKRTMKKDYFKPLDEFGGIIENDIFLLDGDEKFFPGGINVGEGMSGGFHSVPLVGIISLKSDVDEEYILNNYQGVLRDTKMNIVACMGKYMICPSPKNSEDFDISADAPTSMKYDGRSVKAGFDEIDIISRIFGFVNAYLSRVTGRQMNSEYYYFNSDLKT